MDNNITALQNLYVAFGGSLTDTYSDIANGVAVSDYTTKPEIINAIAKVVITVISAELPTVSASDNGKALMVANGVWAKSDIPTELPEVSATDNGKVLKVVDGEWAVGTDLTE